MVDLKKWFLVSSCLMATNGCASRALEIPSMVVDAAQPPPDLPSVATDLAETCDQTVDLSSDPRHCGACFHDCLGAKCSDGLCELGVLVDHQGGITSLAVDGSGVYFTARILGNRYGLFRVDHEGHCPAGVACPELLAEDAVYFGGVALDSGTVYWISGAASSAVRKRPKICSQAACVEKLSLPGLASGTLPVMVVSASLVVAPRNPQDPTKTGIFRITKDFSSITRIGVFSRPASYPLGLASYGQTIFWSEAAETWSEQGVIRSVQLDGSQPRVLLDWAEGAPSSLAVDASAIYFMKGVSTTLAGVARLALGAAAATPFPPPFKDNNWGAYAIVVDDRRVYLSDSTNIWRVDKDGRNSLLLARNYTDIIAFDEQFLYRTVHNGSDIHRVAK
jgi:hypothetical protein